MMDDDRNRQYLDEIGLVLMKELEEAVAWRKPYEQRMLDAKKQVMDGTVDLSINRGTKGAGGTMSTEIRLHERGSDNITAAIWRKTKARISNMLFGTDEPHADIEPSPKAEPSAFGIQPGEPFDASVVEAAAEAMELTIKDRLAEADYAKHGRAVISDGTEVGTGVLYGPYPKEVVQKIGTTQRLPDGRAVMMFELKKKTVSSLTHLDWRRFYPKPARNMAECDGVFLLDLMTKRSFSKLAEDPTYDAAQIKRILSDEVVNKNAAFMKELSESQTGESSLTIKGKYPVFRYIGSIPDKCVKIMCGEEHDGESVFMDGEIVMCQGIIIKSVPRDGEDRLPFHVYNYVKDPNSIFGFGVPHDIAHDQHDANLSWANMKLNARGSSYPIITWNSALMNSEKGAVDWPIQGPIDVDSSDVSKVVSVQTVPSTIGDITMVYERAKQNALEHSMVQSMEQDAPSNPQIGVQMFAMMKIEQNIVTADAAVNWDDSITKPMLQSFIDYELFNGDDPATKGAFDVVPRAVTHLLTKDIQVQQAMQLMQVADHPKNTAFYKRYELNKILVSRTSLPTDQIMNTEDEAKAIQEQEAQQPNPEIMKLEIQERIENMKAANDLEIAKLKAQSDQLVAQMGLEAASIKAASDEVMTQAEQDSRVRIASVTAESKTFIEQQKLSVKQQENAAKTTLEAEKLASKEMGDMLEVKVEKTPRLA